MYLEQGKTIENISDEEKEKYHLFAINLTLRHVWDNTPFYKDKLVEAGFLEPYLSSLSELEKVPLLEKDYLRGNKEILLSVDPIKITQFHLTSGTTGKPIYTAHTLSDQYYHDAIPSYPYLFKGDSSADVVGIALPYELAQPALGFHRLYQFIFGAAVLSLGKGGYMAPLDKSVEAIKDFDVTVIVTTPSYAALLAEEIEKQGLENGKDIKIKKLMLTGEGCSPQFTKRLQIIWNCEIQQIYGSTECGLVGIKHNDEAGYYILEGNLKMEVVDENTGKPLNTGETGEIVITTLLREAMPFVRYKTGDIGFLEEPDPENTTQLRKLHLRGRKGTNIVIEGIDYSPIMLEHFLLMIDEVGLWYQFILDDEELTILIENVDSNTLDSELAERVKQHMYTSTGINCEVDVGTITRVFSKAQRVFYQNNTE
jgi:phenylacetate-CoA ligase